MNRNAAGPLRLTYFHRYPRTANFSIERLFADVRRALPANVQARVAISRFPSSGIWRRTYNVLEAAFRQGDVNHITGDVHFLAYLLRGSRTLLTITDLVSMHRLSGWRKGCLLFLWYWLPVRRAALISVISESTRQELLRYVRVDPRRIRVVYCPVSDAFQPSAKAFANDRPVILQLGTGRNKNVEGVAQALKGLPCVLRIIGRLSESQTRVLRDCGIAYSAAAAIPDAQIVEEFRACDLLVFASTYEGFGMPIIEAQATGRPVVTSNLLSMPEVAGGAACLVDPYDPRSIRAGIEQVVHNREYREALVVGGFRNIERFRPAAIAEQYVAIYRELVGAPYVPNAPDASVAAE